MSTNPLTIINELGPYADLLLESDQWLDNQQRDLAIRISLLTGQLSRIQKAKRCKQQLQQSNRVAVKVNTEVRIAPLPDAIQKLREDQDGLRQQVSVWHSDGYDVESAAHLR